MPSEQDLEFDLMMECFERYLATKKEYDDAFNLYAGYSWGYHGSELRTAMDNARAAARAALHDFIVASVAKGITASRDVKKGHHAGD